MERIGRSTLIIQKRPATGKKMFQKKIKHKAFLIQFVTSHKQNRLATFVA